MNEETLNKLVEFIKKHNVSLHISESDAVWHVAICSAGTDTDFVIAQGDHESLDNAVTSAMDHFAKYE